jgi:hypothetical protein
MELCKYCEEYHVETQPIGSGERIPMDNGRTVHMCEHCEEYSIKETNDGPRDQTKD